MKKVTILCLILLLGISVFSSWGGNNDMALYAAQGDTQAAFGIVDGESVVSFTIISEPMPPDASFLYMEDAPILEDTSSELAGF